MSTHDDFRMAYIAIFAGNAPSHDVIHCDDKRTQLRVL